MKSVITYFHIAIVAACLALSGCSLNDAGFEPPGNNSGSEIVSVYISGKVSDGNEGVEGIRVKLNNPQIVNSGGISTLTNTNGIFFLSADNIDIGEYPNQELIVDVTDIDGDDNGGYYNNRRLIIPVEYSLNGRVEISMLDIVLERYPD